MTFNAHKNCSHSFLIGILKIKPYNPTKLSHIVLVYGSEIDFKYLIQNS
jgi:hypothetical protein